MPARGQARRSSSVPAGRKRRLAYVGITRAQRTLTFTLAKRRKTYGNRESGEPSRFLAELPAEDLEWEGAGVELAPEIKQERGRAHLANLKGLLGKRCGGRTGQETVARLRRAPNRVSGPPSTASMRARMPLRQRGNSGDGVV